MYSFASIMSRFLTLIIIGSLYFIQLNAEECSDGRPLLTGIRVDSGEIAGESDGVVEIPPETPISIRLFGCNLNHLHQLIFTNDHSLCNSSKLYEDFFVYGGESVSFVVEFDKESIGDHFDCRNLKISSKGFNLIET